MQKNVGKNTKKLYFTTAIISFVLVLAISLTLIFTLGGRSSSGSESGNNSGTIGSVSTSLNVEKGELTEGTGLKAENTTTEYNVTVTNKSDFPVYLRAKVILTSSATKGGNYFNYDSAWTYAADNYLYYKKAVAKNDKSTALFTTANVTGTYRFIVEALQEEAAVPKVDVELDSNAVANANLENTASSSAIQNGLLKYSFKLGALTSKSGTRSVSITNNGKQDLDVKFRIASSKWMVESAKVGIVDRKVEFFQNAGYYQLVGKLAIGETTTITLGDANKKNGGLSEETSIDFTLQDYIVATDVYSLVDSNLENVSSKVKDENYTYTIPAGKGSDLYVYSYNNVNKFVYVKVITTETYTLDGAWGNFEGEKTGVSGAVISPKSKSAKLFSVAPSREFQIKVWTAQTIDNATISVIKATSALNNGTTGNYQPVDSAAGDDVTTASMILAAGTGYTDSSITDQWSNLAIKSNDSSDMLVRVSLSFAWGTYSNSVWTPNTDALGFSPSVFYGDGFSFNSEDQSLTYNYNLSKGQATSALLDFTDTTTSGQTRATELTKMVAAINAKNQALKLSVMVEAIYAVGSQLDILKLTNTPTATSDSYYTSDAIGANYTSMTKTLGIITGSASDLAESLSSYVVYVTNNFPVGVRVAVALQWGKLSETTWIASTSDAGANSTVNLGQYLTSNWNFDTSLGGYNYKCSIPGKCATLPIFDSTKLKDSTNGLAALIASESKNHTGEVLRVVIMAETTHKV